MGSAGRSGSVGSWKTKAVANPALPGIKTCLNEVKELQMHEKWAEADLFHNEDHKRLVPRRNMPGRD